MCSELTPRARIPDTRIPQLMQPWRLWWSHWLLLLLLPMIVEAMFWGFSKIEGRFQFWKTSWRVMTKRRCYRQGITILNWVEGRPSILEKRLTRKKWAILGLITLWKWPEFFSHTFLTYKRFIFCKKKWSASVLDFMCIPTLFKHDGVTSPILSTEDYPQLWWDGMD